MIIQNNISPETLVQDVKLDLKPYDVTNRTEKFKVAQQYAKENDLTLCSNGRLFRKNKVGILPEMLKIFGEKRKVVKNEMKDRQRLVEYAKLKLNEK